MTGTIRRGKVIRADLALWDGRTSTHTRTDATGGTLTGLVVGNEVDALQVFGSGTNRDRATLAAAIDHIGTSSVSLVLAPGTWTVDAALTIPANITLHVPAGCLIQPASGITVTVNGPVDAGRYQIFDVSAGGAFAGLRYSIPQWFGAQADTSTDDYTAIDAAVDAAASGGEVHFPQGVYIVGVNSALNLFTLEDSIVISGVGSTASEIRTTGTPSADRTIFLVSATHTATIRDLKLTGPSSDGSGNSKGIRHAGTSGRLHVYDVWLHQWQDAIKKDSGASCEVFVDSCRFTSLRQTGYLDVTSSGRAIVTNCVFDTIGSSNLHHGIYFQSPFTELIVSNCSFRSITGYGIHRFTSGASSGNGFVSITGCSFSSNTTGDVIIDDSGGTVDSNVAIAGCSFASATGLFIWADNVMVSGNAFRCATKCIDTTGATASGGNVAITGNTFLFSGTLGIEVTIDDNAGWTISGNTFIQGGSGTSDTAIRIDNGTDIKIDGNTFRMNNGQPLRCRTASNRIYFTNNQVTGTTNSAGIYIQSTATDPGVFVVANNQLAQTDRGVTVEVTGATIEDNYIAASSPISVSGGKTARIRYNQGYVTENSGTGSIASGATTATVTHGLSVTPTVDDISITFAEQGTADYGRWWVDTIGATTFRLNVSVDPGASNLDFGWRAGCL